MNPDPQGNSITISCDSFEEFDVDATTGTVTELGRSRADRSYSRSFSPPFISLPEEAAAAKKVWQQIIRRCTEAVPSTKGRRRPLDAGASKHGRIRVTIQRGSYWEEQTGYELDVSEKMCLLLFDTTEPERTGSERNYVIESTTPVLWTEIINIRFEVERPRQEAQAS